MLCSHYIIELFKITKTFFSSFRHLKRYDTIKLVDEISLNFPNLVVIRKYVKIKFKNTGSPCCFLSSRDQKIKNVAKIEQTDYFCLHYWFHILWSLWCKN